MIQEWGGALAENLQLARHEPIVVVHSARAISSGVGPYPAMYHLGRASEVDHQLHRRHPVDIGRLSSVARQTVEQQIAIRPNLPLLGEKMQDLFSDVELLVFQQRPRLQQIADKGAIGGRQTVWNRLPGGDPAHLGPKIEVGAAISSPSLAFEILPQRRLAGTGRSNQQNRPQALISHLAMSPGNLVVRHDYRNYGRLPKPQSPY